MHLHIDEFRNRTVHDLCERIRRMTERQEGFPLQSLRFWQVICEGNGQPIEHENGLYWMMHRDRIIYVGSALSRSFVERLGAHFPVGSHHYMNTFIKGLARQAQLQMQARNNFFIPREILNVAAGHRLGLLHILHRAGRRDASDALNAARQLELSLQTHLEASLQRHRRRIYRLDKRIDDILRPVFDFNQTPHR
jgi:hypothetical protein